jgi:glycosyltransferase involved in cell wall biosynthesis
VTLKRVLHVGKFYPPVSGGIERVVETLCRASAGLVENQVLVMNTTGETIEEEVAGVHVTRVGRIGAVGSVTIAPAFGSWLRRTSADLIVLHEPNPWALLSYALVRPAPPLAIWYHSDVVRPPLQYRLFYAPLARPAYSRAARFIVSSPALGDHAAALEPYRSRIRVIPFGIDPSEWVMTERVRSRAAEIARDTGPFVLFAGRHVSYKGVDVLLRALQGTAVRAVIAGDGPRRTAWESLARELGVDARVRFTGDVSDVELRALLHAASMLVLPSITRAEAFGYVQLEAMACATPIVSTDVPTGVSWVNQHERTGLVVRAGDAGALRAAIERLMGDAALRERMGTAGRERVEREFTLARLRDRLCGLYEELGLVARRAQAC